MNAFSLSLLGVVFKATILLCLAWCLIKLANYLRLALRRLLLLTTLALLPLLPLMGWIGLPLEWRVSVEPSPSLSLVADHLDRTVETSASRESGFDPLLMWQWIMQLSPSSDQGEAHAPWTVLGWLYLMGLVIAFIRAGRMGRNFLRFRSRLHPLEDETLQEEIDAFARALGITRRIGIRECDEPNLVATFGVLHPIVVLPPEWRNWSREERRTALAHEVGHIARQDFLIGIFSRLVGCVYFCHPLAHWLRRELAWQQEIDADNLAASLLGGRRPYRKFLALLALRLPTEGDRQQALPLPTLTGSYLLRRFEMLRKTDSNRLISHWWKKSLVLLLCGFAVVLTAVESEAESKHETTAEKNLPPFELGYLVPGTKSIIAVRPSEFFAQPGTEKYAKKLDLTLRESLKALAIELPSAFRLDNIEQLVIPCQFASDGSGKPKSRSFSLGGETIFVRMKEKFDWLAFVKSLPVEVITHQNGEMPVYEIKTIVKISPWPFGFFLPDDRSLVVVAFESVESLKKRVDSFAGIKKGETKPGWETLNRAALAFTLDNRDGEYTKQFEKDLADNQDLRDLMTSIERYSVGVELGDDRPIRVMIDATKGTDMDRFQKQLAGLIDRAREMVRAELEQGKDDSAPGGEIFLEVTERPKVKIEGQRLDWQGFSKVRAKDLFAQFEQAWEGQKK